MNRSIGNLLRLLERMLAIRDGVTRISILFLSDFAHGEFGTTSITVLLFSESANV
jgi:hypothetical protein